MTAETPEYDETAIDFLEAMWGEGYLSPGGAEEVARVLSGLSLKGLAVLDIGCGSGGITLDLARRYGAATVVGLDVEAPPIERARRRVEAAGLSARVTFLQVSPGPLPFEAERFDLVFSKDAMVHIADKDAIFSEIFRVLRPGGLFAASDWLIAHDDTPSPAMAAYLAAEGLSFGMASARRYAEALAGAGFVDVATQSRNAWYREIARGELARLSGEDRERFVAAVGQAYVDKNIRTWQAMLPVLETGEHQPTHLRARKPG